MQGAADAGPGVGRGGQRPGGPDDDGVGVTEAGVERRPDIDGTTPGTSGPDSGTGTGASIGGTGEGNVNTSINGINGDNNGGTAGGPTGGMLP